MPTTMSADTEQSDAVQLTVVEDSEVCPVADGVESPFICSTEDWMPFSGGLRDSGCGPSPDEGRTSEEEEGRGYMNLRHKLNRNRIEGRTRPKRETARNMCRPLKQWLYAHRDLPYPNKAEKLDLAAKSKMTITQVSNWFANARRRLKKTVSSSQPGPLSWERRIKLYNRNVVGNQERLSISSDDSSDDDDDDEQQLDDDDEQHAGGSVYGDEIDFVSYETASNTNSPPSSPTTKPSSSTSSGNYSSSSSSSSGVGGEKDALAAQGDHCPGKFKQGIMQRYLSDAYRVNLGEGGSLVDVMRMRNASGSLSSQDYEEEELSTGGSSPRSTPVKEQQAEDNLEKSDVYRAGYESCLEDSEENDLHTKELSAVLVLMQFAASKRNLSPKVIFRR